MKTPRELLLRQHASAEPKLEAISRQIVASLEPQRQAAPSWWLQCVQSWRVPRVRWSALGAAWLVIIALNVASQDGKPAQAEAVAPSAEVVAELREQKRLYAELIGRASPVRTETGAAPRPHSARRPENFYA
jgi:hypothetical protein